VSTELIVAGIPLYINSQYPASHSPPTLPALLTEFERVAWSCPLQLNKSCNNMVPAMRNTFEIVIMFPVKIMNKGYQQLNTPADIFLLNFSPA
jgi:hypothetical protein